MPASVEAVSGSGKFFQYVVADWAQGYVEALVRDVPPTDADGAERIAAARDGAMDKLYFDLAAFVVGTHINGDTRSHENIVSRVDPTGNETRYTERYESYARSEMRKNEVSKLLTGSIELTEEEWDGDFYSICGRLPLSRISEISTLPKK
jgi:hypothetical protein